MYICAFASASGSDSGSGSGFGFGFVLWVSGAAPAGVGAVAASNLLFMPRHMCYGNASINRTNCCWPACVGYKLCVCSGDVGASNPKWKILAQDTLVGK